MTLDLLVFRSDVGVLEHVGVHTLPLADGRALDVPVQLLDQLLVIIFGLFVIRIRILLIHLTGLRQDTQPDGAGEPAIALHLLHAEGLWLELLEVNVVVEVFRGE